ncbi:MAG: hypothetical protein ABH840_04020 [Nanoarchaeota archaeon]
MPIETIFTNPLFSQIILPFLLVFVLVFAILDKTKLLGDGKRQINAIISLVIALIFLGFAQAVGIVVNLIPVVSVVLVIILVFYLMLGFVFNDESGLRINKGMKIAGGIIVFLILIVAVLVVTDYWSKFLSFFSGGGSWVSTLIMVAAIIGALAVVLATGKKT